MSNKGSTRTRNNKTESEIRDVEKSNQCLMQMKKQERQKKKVRKINSEPKSFQSTPPGTQMAAFARDEQLIKMRDTRESRRKQHRMGWRQHFSLHPLVLMTVVKQDVMTLKYHFTPGRASSTDVWKRESQNEAKDRKYERKERCVRMKKRWRNDAIMQDYMVRICSG